MAAAAYNSSSPIAIFFSVIILCNSFLKFSSSSLSLKSNCFFTAAKLLSALIACCTGLYNNPTPAAPALIDVPPIFEIFSPICLEDSAFANFLLASAALSISFFSSLYFSVVLLKSTFLSLNTLAVSLTCFSSAE